MFQYTLRLDTTRHNEFAWRERWYTRLVLEEMLRKALDPTLVCDRIAKAACCDCSWVWIFGSMKLGTREVAKEL